MRSGHLLVGLAVVAAGAVAALVGVLVAQPFAPTEVGRAVAATTVPVVTEEFSDERSVQVQTQVGPPAAVVTPVGGKLTGWACAPGATIESGASPLAVDGIPLLALTSSVPWWRDLPVGARGGDVDALHVELTRLGLDVTADGDRVGSATVQAVRALLRGIGVTPPRAGPLPMASVVWLPSPSVSVASCAAVLGETLTSGAQVALARPPLVSARVAVMPAPLAAGERVLTVDGIDLAVDATGAIVAPESLLALAGTDAVATAQSADGDGTLPARLRLRDPVTVAVLPPASVATEDGVTGCVLGDGTPWEVGIVGSELGQTFVTFDSGAVPALVSLDAPDGASCR